MECEWRFNNPKPQAQLRQIKQWVKLYLNQLAGSVPFKYLTGVFVTV